MCEMPLRRLRRPAIISSWARFARGAAARRLTAFAGSGVVSSLFLLEMTFVKSTVRFYRDELVLCALALPLGAAMGALCALFGAVLRAVTQFREGHALWLLPLLGLAGAAIVWCYGRFGRDCAKGMGLFFEAQQGRREEIPLLLAPLVMASTWLTHLFGGSAGREGAAVQMGGALGSFLGRWLKDSQERKALMAAGMAAGFGGLFRTPLAAVFFGLEVFRCGRIEFSALLPSLVSAFTASAVSGRLGVEKASFALPANVELGLAGGGKLIVLCVIFSLIGVLFALLLKGARAALERVKLRPALRTLICGTAVGLLSLVCWGGRYSGLGENLIESSFAGQAQPWDFILKALFTAVTLSAGFTGGEFTPLFSIGAAAGAALAPLVGYPAGLCAALGYIAVFTSATNTFFTPLFISAEVFGARYLPLFAVACAMAYILSGNISIYPHQYRGGKFGADESLFKTQSLTRQG